VLESDLFLGKHDVRTVVSIEWKNGKKIVAHSFFQDREEEVILMAGSYFRVKGSLNPSPDFHTIDMEEISPPFQSVSLLKMPVEPPGTVKYPTIKLLTYILINIFLIIYCI